MKKPLIILISYFLFFSYTFSQTTYWIDEFESLQTNWLLDDDWQIQDLSITAIDGPNCIDISEEAIYSIEILNTILNTVSIYNLNGKLIQQLINSFIQEGDHEFK